MWIQFFLQQLVKTTLHQWRSKDSKYRLFWKWPSIACYGVRGSVTALTERRRTVGVEPWHKPGPECTYWFSLSYRNDCKHYSAGDIHRRIWTVYGIMVWTKVQGCYLCYEQQVVCNWVCSSKSGRSNIHDEYNHKDQSLFSSACTFVQSLFNEQTQMCTAFLLTAFGSYNTQCKSFYKQLLNSFYLLKTIQQHELHM